LNGYKGSVSPKVNAGSWDNPAVRGYEQEWRVLATPEIRSLTPVILVMGEIGWELLPKICGMRDRALAR